jgi:hypothetical protein
MLQSPSARTKYTVVTDGETERDEPVPMEAPFPHPPAYQTQLAPFPKEPPLTERVLFPLPQRIGADGEAEEGSTDGVFMVTVMEAQFVILQGPSARTK